MTVIISWAEREAAYAGCRLRWKHRNGRCTEANHTHGRFMDIPFVRFVEGGTYEKRPACLITKLRADGFTWTAADLDSWCSSDHVRDEWATSNHEHWAHDIDFEIRLQQRAVGEFPLFLGSHNNELFSIPRLHSA